jgi:hypothetical protein
MPKQTEIGKEDYFVKLTQYSAIVYIIAIITSSPLFLPQIVFGILTYWAQDLVNITHQQQLSDGRLRPKEMLFYKCMYLVCMLGLIAITVFKMILISRYFI